MKYNIMCPGCSEKIEMLVDSDKLTTETYDNLVIMLKDHCAAKHKDSEKVKLYDETHDGYVIFDENNTQRSFPVIKRFNLGAIK